MSTISDMLPQEPREVQDHEHRQQLSKNASEDGIMSIERDSSLAVTRQGQ